MFIEINHNEIAIIIVTLVYVVLVSVVINRFQRHLRNIHKAKLSLHHARIDEEQLKRIALSNMASIQKLKRLSIVMIFVIGLLHLFTAWIIDLNCLSVLILFVLFLFILLGNYWLKGSTVSSTIRNIPGVSDYHAW